MRYMRYMRVRTSSELLLLTSRLGAGYWTDGLRWRQLCSGCLPLPSLRIRTAAGSSAVHGHVDALQNGALQKRRYHGHRTTPVTKVLRGGRIDCGPAG